jgi:hypothetical protein
MEVDFLIQPHQGWLPQRNARHVRKLGAPTQRKERPQVGHPNARPECKRKARPHVSKLGAPTQRKAHPQVGRPNATQGEFARWAPKRKTHPQRNRPHKGALGKKMSWRMDRTNFGLEVDFLIRPHQGWAPQRNERRVRKTGAQTQCKARPQDGRPNEKPIRNENVHTREH